MSAHAHTGWPRIRDDRAARESLARTLRTLVAHARNIDARLTTMRDGLAGQPRAATYDAAIITGQRSVTWCWRHECDVYLCHAVGLLCDGEPIVVADPTGETAINPDRVAHDRRQVQRHITALEQHAQALADILAGYQPRPPTDIERVASAQLGEPGCQSCARTKGATGLPRYEPVKVRATRVKGRLVQPMALCSWCYAYTLKVHRLPTTTEIAAHHQGRRIRHRDASENLPG